MPEKPDWLRKRLPTGKITQEIEADLMKGSLHTICQEGCCPNQGECFSRGVATFLIIQAVRQRCPGVGIEVLIPDFQGSTSALEAVIKAIPEVLNHNVETVPRLFRDVRPMGNYEQSVALLKKVKEIDRSMITKSGLMVGLGETLEDIANVMDDLRDAGCDILTMGQYLRPSKNHYPVYEYVNHDVYATYEKLAYEKGFKHVAAGPFVRSSYRAEESYKRALNFGKETGGMA
ncbi:MAG: lipoyl synthase [Deltaproteobacteria bacterium]|nr:lipoyl synthase [Deltaproteobacteria bacterium]